MTCKAFFTTAVVTIAIGVVTPGCADEGGNGPQLAQDTPTTTQRTQVAPRGASDGHESTRPGPKPKRQRAPRSAEEKLRKKLGVALEARAPAGCVNIQGDPRLTRLVEGNGDCRPATAGQGGPPPMKLPSPTVATQP